MSNRRDAVGPPFPMRPTAIAAALFVRSMELAAEVREFERRRRLREALMKRAAQDGDETVKVLEMEP